MLDADNETCTEVSEDFLDSIFLGSGYHDAVAIIEKSDLPYFILKDETDADTELDGKSARSLDIIVVTKRSASFIIGRKEQVAIKINERGLVSDRICSVVLTGL